MKQFNFRFLLATLLLLTTSCGILGRKSAIDQNEKQEAAAQKAYEKEYNEAKKQHFEMQSDDTQNMLKKAKRKSEKMRRKQKKSWLKDLFDGK